jgi:hypothetical protein
MAELITATPNPVGFWSPGDTGTTYISWNTNAGDGVVTMSDNGVADLNPFDAPGKSKNSKAFATVMLGHTNTFT